MFLAGWPSSTKRGNVRLPPTPAIPDPIKKLQPSDFGAAEAFLISARAAIARQEAIEHPLC